MDKNQLIGYADFLLQTAIYKTNNITDAQDLVSETLISALAAISQGKAIDKPKSWLLNVLNCKFYDKIRQKYRKPTVNIDVVMDISEDVGIYERLERSEDAENIRRSLGMLTKTYREVMTLFYMEGKTVKEISRLLDIPENTVKSRLNAGRTHIRKDFTMENYTKQSYEPETLWLGISGRDGLNDKPFSLLGDDKIAMNLLILAYEKPVTIPELANAIGISTTYIEPVVEKLVKGELMKKVSNKVYTDFLIRTRFDVERNLPNEKALADKLWREIWSIVEEGLNELRNQNFYKLQKRKAQLMLESHFVVRTVQGGANNIRDELTGGRMPFEEYPDRPDGGKWFAFGYRVPVVGDNDVFDNNIKAEGIDGENSTSLENYSGLKAISLAMYDCKLGKTYQIGDEVPYHLPPNEVMKMLWAIHTENYDDLPKINMHCYDDIDFYIGLNFLSRDENGKILCEVPVIKMSDRRDLYKIEDRFCNRISDDFRDELKKLFVNPIKIPSHLKSVPDWIRYMWCNSSFSMFVILNAKNNGAFLDGITEPTPAVFLAVAE